eukprot:227828-Hanusia_phi.AAC.3
MEGLSEGKEEWDEDEEIVGAIGEGEENGKNVEGEVQEGRIVRAKGDGQHGEKAKDQKREIFPYANYQPTNSKN